MLYALLKVAQNLLHLTFGNCVPRTATPIERILAPKLQYLMLHDCVVDYLHLPALRSLKNFNSPHPSPPIENTAISRLIEHSSCRLEILHIYLHQVDDDFLPLMRLLPSLGQLRLNVRTGSLPSHVIKALHPNIGDVTGLLPNLRELKYIGYTDFRLEYLFMH